MTRSIVVGPVLTGAPLDELKDWLSISGPRDDALLLQLLKSAHATCIQFTGLVPLLTTYDILLTPERDWIDFLVRPVKFIGEIHEKRTDGSERRLGGEEYDVALEADGTGRILLKSAIAEARVEARVITGTATSWNDLDANLKQGIVRLAAHHYRERDSGPGDAPPAAVAALWRPFRRLRL